MQYGGLAPHTYLRGDPMKPVRANDDYIFTYKAVGCADLPSKIVEIPQLGRGVETTWELTGEELAHILQTKCIRLTLVGGQPPVLLEVVEPEEGG